MAKYQSYQKRDTGPKEKPYLHPIWRGVGFVMMVIIPVVSIAAGQYIFEQNKIEHWFGIPSWLVIRFFKFDPFILAKVVLILLLMVIITSVLYTLSVFIIRVFGGPRYGPYDVPPVPYKAPKKR
jgi:hypothetical protein